MLLILTIGLFAKTNFKLRGLDGGDMDSCGCDNSKHNHKCNDNDSDHSCQAPKQIVICDWRGARGAPGCMGDKGRDGPDGNTGPQGNPGPTGLVGSTGPTGDIGATGPQGSQGPVGDIGAQGPPGPPATAGAPGPVGATGPAGPIGATGSVGTPGIPCSCSRPVITTKLACDQIKFAHANAKIFYNVDTELDISIGGSSGLILAFANGGYHLPDKCNAEFELDFVLDDSTSITFFSGNTNPSSNLGDHAGSSYASSKDCYLYIPVGFAQATRVDARNQKIHLYGRGATDTLFKDLAVQIVFFPDCRDSTST